ncbi:hypothetical protein LPJ61_004258, partial [Coemansia biformis]
PVGRESHSVRDSPVRHERSEERLETLPQKRARNYDQAGGGNSSTEPTRQRAAAVSDLESLPRPPSASGTQSRRQPSSQPTAKMSSEEVDRKRKELRAQLLKQQEEKHKQTSTAPSSEPAGKPESDAPLPRASGSRQGRRGSESAEGAASPPGRKGMGDRPGSSGGGRHGPKRGRGTEPRDWDDGKRHRK